MLPTWDQIQRAAYERWERRGWAHGSDQDDWVAAEMDLTFQLNYRPAAEYPLASYEPIIVGSRTRPSCRFCERAEPRTKFSAARPITPATLGETSLRCAEICDECHAQFVDSIDRDFAGFWRSVHQARDLWEGPSSIPVGAFKALARTALAIMPARELQHFEDTVEWVGNPDHDFDGALFAGTGCLVYRTRFAHATPWVSLSRRTDPDVPLPYSVFALIWGRDVVEIALPLCARDQDHEGSAHQLPPRSFTTGFGGEALSARSRRIPLEMSERPRRRGMRLFA
ncbi:DUF2934 domain-containing protein [Paludisphaera rhizosphaerae]|uniref:DUF2934 domain-containing protein n=1 Tax=Paludisphaera rhizosphaerae TaxID=2711216 RepID=UPI0013EA0835|nr:DUF2934 domain-containing protein [Paludisphaera rhizosphaerae]